MGGAAGWGRGRRGKGAFCSLHSVLWALQGCPRLPPSPPTTALLSHHLTFPPWLSRPLLLSLTHSFLSLAKSLMHACSPSVYFVLTPRPGLVSSSVRSLPWLPRELSWLGRPHTLSPQWTPATHFLEKLSSVTIVFLDVPPGPKAHHLTWAIKLLQDFFSS